MEKKLNDIISAQDLAITFLTLESYTDIYKDGAATASDMLRYIRQAYAESYKGRLTHELAIEIANPPRPGYGGGRPGLPDSVRTEILRKKAEGLNADTIAAQCGVSRRSVYNVYREAAKHDQTKK